MQDVVIGTAVLAELEPGQKWLFICCLSADRHHCEQTAIRAVEKGQAHNHDAGRPVWTYEFKADSLIEVKPSVWWKYTDAENKEHDFFHNQGQWTIPVCCEDSPTAGETADRLNAQLRQEWRDKWIKRNP